MWRSRTRMSGEITSIIRASCETKSTQQIQRCLNICRELKSIRAELNVPLVWIQFSSSLTSLHLLYRTSELKKLLRHWLWWTRSWPAIQKKKKSDIRFKILPESQNHFHGCLIFTSLFLYAVVLDIVIISKCWQISLLL